MVIRSFQVDAGRAGQRLDVVLADCLQISRSAAAKLIKSEQVRVGGELAKASDLLTLGAEVKVDLRAEPVLEVAAPKLEVLYEDGDLMVVDKPANLAVHLSETGRPQPTVAAFAAAKGVKDDDLDRPGIVHRLDKDTSGVMVIAKHRKSKEYLQALFAARKVQKTYTALVVGRLKEDEATICLPISRSRTQPVKRSVVPGGRMAVTHYKTLQVFPGAQLLEINLETGRTHQIRVHFSHLGHPVVGDSLYGGGKSQLPRLDRQFLHASRIVFVGPSGQDIDISSPLPKQLSQYLSNI